MRDSWLSQAQYGMQAGACFFSIWTMLAQGWHPPPPYPVCLCAACAATHRALFSTGVTDKAAELASAASQATSQLTGSASKAASDLTAAVSGVAGGVTGKVTNLTSSLGQGASEVAGSVGSTLNSTLSAFKGGLDQVAGKGQDNH